MAAVMHWAEVNQTVPGDGPPSPWVGPAVAFAVAIMLVATGHGVAAAALVAVATTVTVASRVSPGADAAISRVTSLAGRIAFRALSVVLLAIVGVIVLGVAINQTPPLQVAIATKNYLFLWSVFFVFAVGYQQLSVGNEPPFGGNGAGRVLGMPFVDVRGRHDILAGQIEHARYQIRTGGITGGLFAKSHASNEVARHIGGEGNHGRTAFSAQLHDRLPDKAALFQGDSFGAFAADV